MTTPTPRMSHHDRQVRRRNMARLVADGQRCSAVAKRFGLARFTAIAAAREFGVNISDRRRTLNTPVKGAA